MEGRRIDETTIGGFMTHGVVIVGAGFAGASTAIALRDAGYEGRIRLVGEEPSLPYRRSSLAWTFRSMAKPELVAPASEYQRLGIELLLDTTVTGCGPGSVEIGPEVIRADHVVLATGASPRMASIQPQPQVHALASIDDGRWLKADLSGASSIMLLGAGLVNLQLASLLMSQTSAHVVMVDPHPRPVERVFGSGAGQLVLAAMRSAGIGLSATRVAAVVPVMRSVMAYLDDGRRVLADAVVVAAGTSARMDLARECGAVAEDGIRCDGSGRTTIPGLWAVGAAAEWDYGHLGRQRISSETTIGRQARRMAETLMGHRHDDSLLPGHVVELFGMRCDIAGVVGIGDVEVGASLPSGRGWLELRNDRVTASITLEHPAVVP